MQLMEGFSWQRAIQDATRRGLELRQNQSRWLLSLRAEDRDVFMEKARLAGLSPNPIDMYGYQHTWVFVTAKDYKKQADRLESTRKNPAQALEDIRSNMVESAWNELQELKGKVLTYRRPGQYQLFVPRPQIFREYYPDAPVLRTVPAGMGDNKPHSAFWTSTLAFSYEKDGKKYYSSDWVDWLENAGMKKWWNPIGFVYTYQESADIYPMHSAYDAKKIYHIMKNLKGEPADTDGGDGLYRDQNLRTGMPWSDIAKHFDAVYHYGRTGSEDHFMYGWDAESTAWLNTNVLRLVSKVRIRPISSYEYDDDD